MTKASKHTCIDCGCTFDDYVIPSSIRVGLLEGVDKNFPRCRECNHKSDLQSDFRVKSDVETNIMETEQTTKASKETLREKLIKMALPISVENNGKHYYSIDIEELSNEIDQAVLQGKIDVLEEVLEQNDDIVNADSRQESVIYPEYINIDIVIRLLNKLKQEKK